MSTAELEVAASVKQLVLGTLSVKSEVPFTVLSRKNEVKTTDESAENSYNFQYSTSSNIGGFLSSLIGANVSLDLQEGTSSSGYVLLLEKKDEIIEGTNHAPVVRDKYFAVHLISDIGSIERIPLGSVKNVRLLDQHLQEQLIMSLRKRVCPPPKTKKSRKGTDSTTIGFSSLTRKEENINISYLDKCTEWKCMYRMEISSNEKDDFTVIDTGLSASQQEQVHMQVIGNVTNSSDEDWTDVTLSLVANELSIIQEVVQK